jgi:hypothetical protein
VIQRLKCLEARLRDYEEGKKEAIQLNEELVKKLKACEMLRSRGEQFIDGLYKALDQGKPVKLTNSKGHTVSFLNFFLIILMYSYIIHYTSSVY